MQAVSTPTIVNDAFIVILWEIQFFQNDCCVTFNLALLVNDEADVDEANKYGSCKFICNFNIMVRTLYVVVEKIMLCITGGVS